MGINIDISAEYAAFGFQANYQPVIPEASENAKGTERTLNGRERHYPDLGDLNGHSILGIPLWMPAGFVVDGELIQLPNEPIFTLSKQKIIKKTSLAGNSNRGTVKESIATGDWSIKIEGLCIDPFKRGFPEDQVQLINFIDQQDEPLQLKNYLTELNGIDMVVVENLKWKKLHGTPFSIGYVMILTSDNEFELIIK